MYGKLLDFARAYPFDPEAEDYLVHITTGTHVAQICLFLLKASWNVHRHRAFQDNSPPPKGNHGVTLSVRQNEQDYRLGRSAPLFRGSEKITQRACD